MNPQTNQERTPEQPTDNEVTRLREQLKACKADLARLQHNHEVEVTQLVKCVRGNLLAALDTDDQGQSVVHLIAECAGGLIKAKAERDELQAAIHELTAQHQPE